MLAFLIVTIIILCYYILNVIILGENMGKYSVEEILSEMKNCIPLDGKVGTAFTGSSSKYGAESKNYKKIS